MLRTFSLLHLRAAFLLAMMPISTPAQIVVESFQTFDVVIPNQSTQYLLEPSFNTGAGDFLVVAVAFESVAIQDEPTPSALTFDGVDVPLIISSSNSGDQTAVFALAGVSGSGPLMFSVNGTINFPGFYAASLSGASGVETFDAVNDAVAGDFDVTLTGVSAGSYVLGAYSDQLGGNQFTDVTGDLDPVHDFGGDSGDRIGSAIAAVVAGFGDGSDLSVTFTDTATLEQQQQSPGFQNRSNFSFVAIAAAGDGELLGDVNCDGVVDLLDVGPFVDIVSRGEFSTKADIDGDDAVTLLDVGPFVDLLIGG